MVEASELRIGNLVDTEYGELSVHASMLVDIVNNGFAVTPIPLTTEILEKCGFKAVEGWADDLYHNGHYTVMARFNKFQINGVRYEVKYLHQLQNIHFALKGEELQIDFQ